MREAVPRLAGRPEGRVQIARYARTGRGGARSAQARLRATLEREGPALEAALERTRSESLVYIDPQGEAPGQGQRTASDIASGGASDAAERMTRALVERMLAAGAPEGEIEHARARWKRTALEDVQGWMAARCGSRHDWESILERIRGMRDLAPLTMALGRWALLAELGSALVEKVGRADPWVASEACQTLGRDALLGPERAWPGAIVIAHARRLGRGDAVGARDAEAALADWRWPGARPPCTLVAAGAGVLAPIRGDGAWAHAIDAEGGANKVWVEDGGGKTPPHEWARAERKGEETARARVAETVGWLARRWIGEAAGDATGTGRTLARWTDEWAANARLPGDGRRFAPALTAQGARVVWSAAIEGPGALLARCQLSGERPKTVMRAGGPERAPTLRLSVHRQRYWAWRESAGHAGEARGRDIAPSGLGAPIDEIAALDARAGAYTQARQPSTVRLRAVRQRSE